MTFKPFLIAAIISTLALLSACASNSDKKETAVEKTILSALEKDPSNKALLGQAGDFYRTRFYQNSKTQDAKKSISYYQQFLKGQEQHAGANILIYDVSYKLHANTNTRTLDQLNDHFQKIPKKQREYINPPEVAEILKLLSINKIDDNKLRKLALAGIKNSPKNHVAYLLISGAYLDEENYISAIALLKQGIKHLPENATMLYSLGEAYASKAYQHDCPAVATRDLKNTENYYTQSKKLDPKNHDINADLSYLYFWLNKLPLGLHEAKIAHKASPSKSSFMDLVQAHILNKQYVKTSELLKEESTYTTQLSPLTKAEYYLRLGLWDKAVSQYQKVHLDKEGDYKLYNVIQAEIAAHLANANWSPSIDVANAAQTQWQKHLIHFWQGQLTSEELIAQANTPCDRLEGHTYIGYKYLIDNKNEQARQHFLSASDQGVPLFIEDALSKQLLEVLKQ